MHQVVPIRRNDAKLDKMIADATAATGSEERLCGKTPPYIHDDVVIMFLFHMVGFAV